ncbi:ARM repeat-containing protein [Stereum hirsutum FP-91666 SS1]|uniref:ARM repeat-containing protein n=1 Tax=Stereum hirsutum (strain FP-91666) TaxID=721885 RepID=UPI0004449410|nr:ARM repeat-containing protein [Stereum hirsutum FP-91666 SS1]EIM82945.1 ARM repeat-containing protein [Stereum hirsutum FP-91666 SS1]
MSQQQTAAKPSLQGVRIKARKGAVKAHAKHEPTIFRDQLYKHLEAVPPGDFEVVTSKLVQAGSTLEFLKYADALFDILIVGGLLQPGGQYLDEEGPSSPFSVFQAKEPPELDDIRKYVEVFNKLIRRYKYLQKPLETSVLPTLLQYVNKWDQIQTTKFAMCTGLLIAQNLANASCLLSLTREHLVKNDHAIFVLAQIFRAYLAEASMEHLSTALKKANIKDLSLFFPPNKRDNKSLEEFFRKEQIPQVAEWWTKRQNALIKEEITKIVHDMLDHEDTPDNIVNAVKTTVEERPLAESEVIACLWQGLMSAVDWSARADQIEGLALREVTKYAPILEPFCNGPKTEVSLINSVQVYCYEDTRIMKAFPQILKVLYNKDCISDQAIIYWHQKGSKPQGRQHFLKSTETLVKFLQEQEEESDEEEA